MCTLRCCASNALHCDALHAILCVTKKPCNTSPGTGKTDLRAPVLPGFTFKRFSLSSECSRLHKRDNTEHPCRLTIVRHCVDANPPNAGATTCLSAAQHARKQLGAPSLLRVESTVCFQRKRGLPSSRLTKAGQVCVVGF